MDQFMWEKKINKWNNMKLLCNFITEIILMKVYNMTVPEKHFHVKFYTFGCLSYTSCVLLGSLLHCISGLFANMGGIAISCDSEVIKCQNRHGRGRYMGGKEKWGMAGEYKVEKRIYMESMWSSFLLMVSCLPMSDIVWQHAHVSF